MFKVYSKSNTYFCGRHNLSNKLFGGTNHVGKTLHVSSPTNFPQVAVLKLPTNVVDINASEMGRFSPCRERDISGPVLSSFYEKKNENYSRIDITVQADPHVNKYDCQGALSLSSSMQSNVPSPFSGNQTHLGMPGSQWGQGYKYLSDHLHGAHYLTLRNEYRDNIMNKVVTIGTRDMSTDTRTVLTSKEKLKQAVKEYGSTVIVFHITISILSLGGCYILVNSGVDLTELLKDFNIGEGAISKLVTSNAGTFVVAYAIHKCFAPFRIAVTLGATPFIVRYLRNTGFIKRNLNSGGGK